MKTTQNITIMNKFNELAKASNKAGVEAVQKYLDPSWKLTIEPGKTANDLRVTKPNGDIILIEVKKRGKYYDTDMLEEAKVKTLSKRADKLHPVAIWYLMISPGGVDVCYNLTEILQPENIFNRETEKVSFAETYKYPEHILKAKLLTRKFTAINSGSELKLCYFIPKKFRMKPYLKITKVKQLF